MLEFPLYYSKMHISTNNMSNLVDDIENLHATHLKDFHPNHAGSVLTTTYGSSAQLVSEDFTSPSLTIYVSGGVSYTQNSQRIETKIPIIGETQTTSTSSTVSLDYPIIDVDSIYTTTTGDGTDYYSPSGSFNSTTKVVNFGTPITGHPDTVYVNYYRMPSYTFTSVPTGAAGTDITRIDLLYLEYEKDEVDPFSIDFINSNREVYQEVVYTRERDGFDVKSIAGTQVTPPAVASAPTTPSGSNIVPIAYVYWRNNSTAIYDYDTGNSGESYIVDARSTI